MRIPKCKECEHLTQEKKYYPATNTIAIEQYCNYGGISVRMDGYVLSPKWCPKREVNKKEQEGKK
jgi:hypothetical protein